jgi:hypothetical protein
MGGRKLMSNTFKFFSQLFHLSSSDRALARDPTSVSSVESDVPPGSETGTLSSWQRPETHRVDERSDSNSNLPFIQDMVKDLP